MSISTPTTSVDATLEIPEGICVLCHDPINVDQVTNSVRDDAAGASAVFIGSTRNSFKGFLNLDLFPGLYNGSIGKTVTRLEYQAYSKLAIKTMANIIQAAATTISRSDHHPDSQKVRSLIRCAVYHRLGTVPVGEPSIVIAVSSPHRKEALVACELILEEVKRKAQIWKREYYEGESESEAEWKENV